MAKKRRIDEKTQVSKVPLKFTRSFLTGSRAYGLPHKKSDIDLVVYISEEDLTKLEHEADEVIGEGAEELNELYEKFHSRPLRFGILNIIACTDAKYFDLWRRGTRMLKKQAPVSRAFACRYFDKLRRELLDEDDRKE